MQGINGIFYVVVLIVSIVIHEVAHGYFAEQEGDPTARLAGRLTLNPIAHLELFGSIILPFILIVAHAPFVVGWAKPVPVNPYNFRNARRGILRVSLAGVFANLIIATAFGILIRCAYAFHFATAPLIEASTIIVIVNTVLAIFNLIPIPPLDGSKVLFELLPPRFKHIERFMIGNHLLLLIAFILFVWPYIAPFFISGLFGLLTGISV